MAKKAGHVNVSLVIIALHCLPATSKVYVEETNILIKFNVLTCLELSPNTRTSDPDVTNSRFC